MRTTRDQRRQLQRDNQAWPITLREIPREAWPDAMQAAANLQRVWRSHDFLVQQFEAPEPATCRLSVCRTQQLGATWVGDISWDELQDLKTQAGFGFSFAVEVYPSALDVVNVANMRHLWILAEAPAFAWRRNSAEI